MVGILERTAAFEEAAISYPDRRLLSGIRVPCQHNLVMKRSDVRALKRQARGDNSPEGLVAARNASLALLERSIRFGHKKLALKRLSDAVTLGAALDPEHFRYCREIVCSGVAARNGVRSCSLLPQ